MNNIDSDKLKKIEEELIKIKEEKLNQNEDKCFEILMPKVLRYSQYTPRTEYEVENRFKEEFEENPKIKEYIFEYLLENKIIDDKSYALNYIHDALLFKRNSIFELKMKLREKKIDDEYINIALEKYEDKINEYEQKVIIGYLKQRKNIDILKTKAYLFRKGFKSENIKNAILDYEYLNNKDKN